jgi:hypothetical protein
MTASDQQEAPGKDNQRAIVFAFLAVWALGGNCFRAGSENEIEGRTSETLGPFDRSREFQQPVNK